MRWARRFWIRLLSSGSVTSVQSSSSDPAFDFLDVDDLLLFRELDPELDPELRLELPAMSIPSNDDDEAASVEDRFRLWRWCDGHVLAGRDFVRRGASPGRSGGLGLLLLLLSLSSDGGGGSSGIPGEALWMRIWGGDLWRVDLGEDIYRPGK